MNSNKFDVVGFGALNVDYFYKVGHTFATKFYVTAGREFPGKRFETFVRDIQKEKFLGRSGGGQAANTIFALSQMGFKTGFIGKVGEDEEGEFLINSLGGVDVLQMKRSGRSGMLFSIQQYDDSERCMFVFPNANDTLTVSDVDLDYFNSAKILHLSSFVGDISFKTQKYILKHVLPAVLVSFNPGEIYARKGLKRLLVFFKRSFIVFLSENEVFLLTFEDDYKIGAKELLKLGPKIIVVTLGSQGSYILSEKEEYSIPPYKVNKIIETTGAGDVYNAGFLAGLLLKKSLKKCGDFAARIAAKSITGVGRSKYPTKSDMNYI